MSLSRFRAWVAIVVGLGVVLCGCDWPMYGFDLKRSGENPLEGALGAGNAGRLHQVWSVPLGGASDTSPIVATQVTVAGTPHQVVYVGSENGDFLAIDASNGRVLWRRFLGRQLTGCLDLPFGVAGITGAAALDTPRSRIYVAGGDGKLYALNLATGATLPGWPITLTADPGHEHVWGGLTLTGPRLYYTIASFCDVPPYRGRVGAVDVTSRLSLGVFYPTGPSGPYGGGIWGWGGASVDPGTGDVYVATGNALAANETVGYADAVVRLSATLRVLDAHHPRLRPGFDQDFGSTPTLFDPPGCPPLLAAENKDGEAFIYARNALARGPLATVPMGGFFVGMPAYSAATGLLYVSNPIDVGFFRHGIVALRFGPNCQLQLAWQTAAGGGGPFSIVSTPSVANGVVYFGDGLGNQVFALDARSGRLLWRSATTIAGAVFAAPVVANGQLLVAARDGRLHAFAA